MKMMLKMYIISAMIGANNMFDTPQNYFELVSKEILFFKDKGTPRRTRKTIMWSIGQEYECPCSHKMTKWIEIWQKNGAKIRIAIQPYNEELNEATRFVYEGQPQKSFDLLATFLAHYGNTQRVKL